MTWEIAYVTGVIVLALILFVKEFVSIDITAILVSVLLMASGIVTLKQGLSGFSNEAALAILALLILNTGLESTGLIEKISTLLSKFTGNSPWAILIFMLPIVSLLSAFTNHTAVVSIFLPIILSIANVKKVSASKLLMPMAFISILGGICTLIGTSTNLLVNSIARQYKVETFSFFEFTKIGIVLLAVGLIYAIFIQHRLLPGRRRYIKLEEEYQLKEYLTEIVILESSHLIGDFEHAKKILSEANVLLVKHLDGNGNTTSPFDMPPLKEGDRLLVETDLQNILSLKENFGISIQKTDDQPFLDGNSENQLVEVVITPGSRLAGEPIKSINFRKHYDAVLLGIIHSGKNIDKIGDIKMRAGDALLLETNQNIFSSSDIKNDLLLLNRVNPSYSNKKRMIVLSILVGVVGFAALGIVPIVVSALAGCILMFVTG